MCKVSFAFVMISALCLNGCTNTSREIVKDGLSLRGNIRISSTDTSFEGPIEYYNAAKELVELANYHENKRQGKAISYYSNGKPQEEDYYVSGNITGQTKIYDSLGKIVQKVNYWNGLALGSEEFYKNDSLETYRFVNFEGIQLYRAKYDNPKGLIESGSPLYYVSNYSDDDNLRRIKVFIYLMNPPGKRLNYKIFDTDTIRKDTAFLRVVKAEDGQEFAFFYLGIPKENHKYFFEIKAFYPRSGITVKNILHQDEGNLEMPR